MKTKLKILIIVTLISTLFTTTSCLKDYYCECIINGSPKEYYMPIVTKAKAKAQCDDYDATVKRGALTPYDGCGLK